MNQYESTYGGGNRGTTTKGKLATIEKQKQIIAKFITDNKINLSGSVSYGLPGPRTQCQRHVDEYKAYKVPESKQRFIELMDNIYTAQQRWAETVGFLGKCLKGNAYEILEERLKAGERIAFIDLDKCQVLEELDLKIIKLASENGVDFLFLTVTTRSQITPDLTKFKRKLGIRKRWNKNNHKMGDPIAVISEKMVAEFATRHGFEVKAIPYFGKQPMMSFVLLNVRKHGQGVNSIGQTWRDAK